MKKEQRQKLLVAELILLNGAVFFVLSLQLFNSQKIALGVKFNGFNVGGIKLEESKRKIEDEWEKIAENEIVLQYQNYSFPIKLRDIGFEADSQITMQKAMQVGRHSQNQLGNIVEQILALVGRYRFGLAYRINDQVFKQTTEQLFKDIEKPAINASLIYDSRTNSFVATSSKDGTIINRKKLAADLAKNITNPSTQPVINLELIADYPTVLKKETSLAMEKTEQILSAEPYALILEDKRWPISQATLLSWLVFEPVSECEFDGSAETDCESDNKVLGIRLDKDKIRSYLIDIAKSINREPVNAVLEIEDKHATKFEPGQDGFELKIRETIEEIEKNILGGTPNAEIAIVAGLAKPDIPLEATNDLGINVLIGQGSSDFGGSPSNRTHNIKTGATKFNGIIVAPNEEFSFLGILGEVGPTQGYLPELVIKSGMIIPEYGGGLCQVSTTAFRAAINSGLEITERRPHAFPVSYYNPQGFDATVYDPSPDFKFINDTPNHLLIETYISGTIIGFNFYGTDDGRKVTVNGPHIIISNPDGSMKTNLIQEITRPDGQTETHQFYSSYKSPNLFKKTSTEKKIETTPAPVAPTTVILE